MRKLSNNSVVHFIHIAQHLYNSLNSIWLFRFILILVMTRYWHLFYALFSADKMFIYSVAMGLLCCNSDLIARLGIQTGITSPPGLIIQGVAPSVTHYYFRSAFRIITFINPYVLLCALLILGYLWIDLRLKNHETEFRSLYSIYQTVNTFLCIDIVLLDLIWGRHYLNMPNDASMEYATNLIATARAVVKK